MPELSDLVQIDQEIDAKSKTFIQSLESNLDEVKNILAKAEKENADLKKDIQEAEEENKRLLGIMTNIIHIKRLTSRQEINGRSIIYSKLLPLTLAYENHLIAESKTINPKITDTDTLLELPKLDSVDEKKQAQYQLINKKFIFVRKLADTLTDTSSESSSQECITKFGELLLESDESLKHHRNPEYKQYIKNCLVALAIFASGIIPGLIGLVAYSRITRKSSPLFFKHSHGEEYLDEVKSIIDNYNKSLSRVC